MKCAGSYREIYRRRGVISRAVVSPKDGVITVNAFSSTEGSAFDPTTRSNLRAFDSSQAVSEQRFCGKPAGV